MTGFEVWLWTRLDSIMVVAVAMMFLGGILSLIATILVIVGKTEEEVAKKRKVELSDEEMGFIVGVRKVHRIVMVIFFIGLPLYLFVPTKKEAAVIYVLPKIVNNEKVQQLPDKVLTLADEWLEELRPDKEKKQ